MNKQAARRIVEALTPPLVLAAARALRRASGLAPAPEYEIARGGWASEMRRADGWAAASVLEAYKAAWPAFVAGLDAPPDLTRLAFEAALLRAASGRNALRVLDWGGGIGGYALLSARLLPGLCLDYTVKDLPLLADHGGQHFHEPPCLKAHFVANDGCLDGDYDLVLASGSIQYTGDWEATLSGLARAARGHLFVTRLPLTDQARFVFRQRAYGTSYPAHAVPRARALEIASAEGLRLVREFALGDPLHIEGAPEPLRPWGLLWERPRAGC